MLLLVGVVVAALVGLSFVLDTVAAPASNGNLTIKIHGTTDQLPPTDSDALVEFDQAVRDWNSLFSPIVAKMNDPTIPPSEWLTAASSISSQAPAIVQDMRSAATAVKHDGLRNLVLDRADVYADEATAFLDVLNALASGDVTAESYARTRLVESSNEGQALAREFMDVLDDIGDRTQ